MRRTLALLVLIALPAVGCSGSKAEQPEVTGTIAFRRGDHVWLMSADGSGQRRLMRGYGHAWSPDGKVAVSVRGKGIYLVDADGRGRLRLTRADDLYDEHDSPAWSPDGKTIAFQGYDDGAYWLSVVRSDGTGQRTITPAPFKDTGPVWSRDGRTIMFTNVNDNTVHAMRPDGSHRRVVARIEDEGRRSCCGPWGVEWSPDRRRFTALVDADLWVMTAGGRRLVKLFDSPIDKPERWSGIAWSPDGRTIAFSVLEGKGEEAESEIHVVDADGNGLRLLTDNGAGPIWSPDGRAIAFVSNRDSNAEIYVMDADGSDQRNVSESPFEDVAPAWSPRS